MNDNAKHFIAGGISGMATVISGYPLGTEFNLEDTTWITRHVTSNEILDFSATIYWIIYHYNSLVWTIYRMVAYNH